jgi:ubiquinone/menaquinone biosynthesis C-methylase UbiE
MDIATPFRPPMPVQRPRPQEDAEPIGALSACDRHGLAVVERLALRRGDSVLEVGCGAGAAALAAACVVGPCGHVVGVDLDEPLLRRARDRARALGMRQADFLRADFTRLPFPDGAFDAVLCLFHFGPELAQRMHELWRLVAAGGTLTVTAWGPEVFEPLDAQERAQMRSIATAPGMAQALHAAGACDVQIEVDGDLVIGRARRPA